MYKTLLLTLVLSLCLQVHTLAQDYSYIHYDTKDGLAGSTVYDISQDRDGFLWFATENGLSRFDGTNFRNFTVKDGLPDNEVLRVFADAKGRVWISTFNQRLCFFYEGVIHDEKTDAILRKLTFNNFLINIAETPNNIVAMSTGDKISLVFPNDSVSTYELADLFGSAASSFVATDVVFNKLYVAAVTGNHTFIRIFNGSSFGPVTEFGHYFDGRSGILIAAGDTNFRPTKFIKLKSDVIRGEAHGTPLTAINSSNGSWIIDTLKNIFSDHLLEGKKVSRTFIDREHQYWFSTLGEGIYKMPSKEIRTIRDNSKSEKGNTEVFSIEWFGNVVIGGLGRTKAIIADSNHVGKEKDYSNIFSATTADYSNNRLFSIKRLSSGVLLLGFDHFIIKQDGNYSSLHNFAPVKSIGEIDNDYILVGTTRYTFKIRVKDFEIVDTIWRGRATKVFYNDGKYYIGTLNGLNMVDQNKNATFMGRLHPALTRRITDIESCSDHTLWVSTSDQGIVGIKDGRIVHVLNDTTGLSSNICKSLFMQHDFLWVGTNKGVNKIDLHSGNYSVMKYSVSDGLPSDVINAIYVKDSIVWVGTPAGLSYFNENKISQYSICKLKLLSVKVSDVAQPIDSAYSLSYSDNNISFEFVAVSFKSGNEINYYYKLDGLEGEWKKTQQTNLDYQSLPSGNYSLSLYAVNKFGVKSDTITVRFSISTPFWKTVWFNILVGIFIILGVYWVINTRNKNMRRSLEEKNRINQQFASLEQQALQAQMNPHFIFNCLNSIQQYILTNDKIRANQYLTGFASLIRQTLDNSDKKSITVGDEIRYLDQYLDMEKMRFADQFDYKIITDPNVNIDYLHMPSMLLQPYVENCIRHGIRHKIDGKGKIDIHFSIGDEMLICNITDNGVGREKASELKSKQHIEYQSKGMHLTEKRIELLNKTSVRKILMFINDLHDENGKASGTEVILKIPV